ncbi:MobA/MobL family protein (plasmid) [Salipiger profundus]|uniref:MobA/MobL family protein n=2 Tax=Roseobacteraceae TaxID=2854170 RepID=A0A1U7DDI1_9RHOB|nr:MobA/MobL family protein [Salipiger profundus]
MYRWTLHFPPPDGYAPFRERLRGRRWRASRMENHMEVQSIHFPSKILKRSKGRNAVAAAAYRAGEALAFGDVTFDFTRKQNVLATRILVPPPPSASESWQWLDRLQDRATLWTEIERKENRKDAQLAREIEISLPAALSAQAREKLVWDFCQRHFVSAGMVADIALHGPGREGDNRNFHAHVMLTMRELTPDGFGKKHRDWNRNELLDEWKTAWEAACNEALAAEGAAVRMDRRPLAARRQELLDRAEATPDRIEQRRLEIAAERLNYTPRPHLPRTPYRALSRGLPIPDYLGKVDNKPALNKWREDVAAWKAAVQSRVEAEERADAMEAALEAEIAAARLREAEQAKAEEEERASRELQDAQEAAAMALFEGLKHQSFARIRVTAAAMLAYDPDPKWNAANELAQALPGIDLSDPRATHATIGKSVAALRAVEEVFEKDGELDDRHDHMTHSMRGLSTSLRIDGWQTTQRRMAEFLPEWIVRTVRHVVEIVAELIRTEQRATPTPQSKGGDSSAGETKPLPPTPGPRPS